jgi:rhodanese-related sulfurtransferase
MHRTVYRYDVRTPEEFSAGHLPGFRSAAGGQLVQETDVFAPVRGARIILADDDGVRAPMTAHWLAQMGWDVAWVDGVSAEHFVTEPEVMEPLPSNALASISTADLAPLIDDGRVAVIDFSPSADYVRRHIRGAWWTLRSQLSEASHRIEDTGGRPQRWIVTAGSEREARFAAHDLQQLTISPVAVLEGGNAAWYDAGFATQTGDGRLASPRIDRYRRPYEGTDNPREAMQAYLDWEFGLVAQLARDATHGFEVLPAR